MQLKLLLETVVHLKPVQLVYQVLDKVSRPKLFNTVAPAIKGGVRIIEPIAKYHCCDGNDFTFLNIKDSFHSWNHTNHGMLWAYNLNYMDWLGQEGMSESGGEKWIDLFIEDLPRNYVGQDPYPIALRSINWIKFFCKYPDSATKPRLDSLYSQLLLLEKKLEYKVLGNHLLEDAYALFIASVYFNDQKLYVKASKLLKKQLIEQVLADGAHYEQSPMYHCILLDRLLDAINFLQNDGGCKKGDVRYLSDVASRMLGHLECVIWEDGSIPLLNDAAFGIAPSVNQLFDYARRLKLSWKAIPMKESGYRKMKDDHFEAIVDIGDITASYQPGHTHADTFNYELRIDRKPFIVDTGTSTYNKTSRRQYERSTRAHNCVSVNGRDSSHVWGGFRVGKRCKVKIISDCENYLHAQHDGYMNSCDRELLLKDNVFAVVDTYKGQAISYIHLAEDADPQRIKIEHYDKIEIVEDKTSTFYNMFSKSKTIKIHFKDYCKYSIKA